MQLKCTKNPKGFTMLEILVSLSILAILMAVVIANYRRGNEDSVLTREVSLLMSRIRLTQEQTAGGTADQYCDQIYYGKSCNNNSDCVGSSPQTCKKDTPVGGYAVSFSCDPNYLWGLSYPKIDQPTSTATTPYFIFGDRLSCGLFCFSNLNPSKWVYGTADGLITLLNQTQGDTLVNTYQLDSKIVFKDLAIKAKNLDLYKCNSSLPWRGQSVTGHDSVPADYPLQAMINFLPPDGRTISITNGISTQSTAGFDWQEVDLMFGLRSRNSDCQVVSVTKDGVINKYIDQNCDFAN